MAQFKKMTVAEAVAAVLVRNGIRYAFGVGGHGNTPLLEAFYPYHRDGVLRVVDVQHEAVAAYAATALRWVYGIESVVFTSIGPGWFNTLIAQNTAMSNGYGFLVLAGDKTTAYEGANMQQILPGGQFGFPMAAGAVTGKAYSLVDPRNVYSLLREALVKTREPGRSGPVNLFLPLNLQAAEHEYNLDRLHRPVPRPAGGLRPNPAEVASAVQAILRHGRIVIRVGGGATGAGPQIKALAERIGAAVVMGPVAMDAIESAFPLNVGPAGSKGSLSGNYAAANATLVINIGGRGVCQADCSGTLFAGAREFININLNPVEAARYDGIPLVGDAAAAVEELIARCPDRRPAPDWLAEIAAARKRWAEYLQEFYDHPCLDGKITQPAAIKWIDDDINAHGGLRIYDAGDVQAHGFQIGAHHAPKTFLSDTGNSAMGFGVSAAFGLGLVEGGRYPTAIVGDGSLLMQAQALRDMVKHRSRCSVVVLDNQAMGAITALQWAQNYRDYATADPPRTPAVDFAALAESMGCPGFRCGPDPASIPECLDRARQTGGPALIDIKVAFSRDPRASLGAFGRWNVGPWSSHVESLWEGKQPPEPSPADP